MKSYPDSDSTVQRKIEARQFRHFQETYAASVPDLMQNHPLPLHSDNRIVLVPDFYSESAGIIGEIHSVPGRLKPAQLHKIAGDILKMLLFEHDYKKEIKKYLIVCNEHAYDQLTGRSHLAETIRQFEIQVLLFPLSSDEEYRLRDAAKRQDLTAKNEKPRG